MSYSTSFCYSIRVQFYFISVRFFFAITLSKFMCGVVLFWVNFYTKKYKKMKAFSSYAVEEFFTECTTKKTFSSCQKNTFFRKKETTVEAKKKFPVTKN